MARSIAAPRPPRQAHAPAPPRPPGMADLGRRPTYTRRSLQSFPDPPPRYPQSRLEWICYWWLTTKRHLRHNLDFFTQMALNAPGLQVTPFTRVDFAIVAGKGTYLGQAGKGQRGICWDPITPFTHPAPSHDKLKRAILATQGWQLIFIEGTDLEPNPERVLILALRGVDVSSRARGSYGR